MIGRLALAKQFISEKLERREDIVGAFVVGSVARGDATEASDIDLVLTVEGQATDQLQRGGIDTWRDGVYIEAALAPKQRYDDAKKLLLDPIEATQVNDALILHDPTGFLTRVQQQVQAVFMDPRWLGIRVQAALRSLRQSMAGLREAVAAGDLLGVCEGEAWTSVWLTSVPLIRHGITPSSTRALLQLEEVWSELKERVCEWQGSTRLSREDVLALLPMVAQGLSLAEGLSESQWGNLPAYMAKKAEWLARNGHHREALHLIWFLVGGLKEVVRASENAALVSTAHGMVRMWVQLVGWDGQEVLEEKVRMAESMVADVEALAADLPSDEDTDAG